MIRQADHYPSLIDWLTATEHHLLDATAWVERALADRAAADEQVVEATHYMHMWQAVTAELRSESSR